MALDRYTTSAQSEFKFVWLSNGWDTKIQSTGLDELTLLGAAPGAPIELKGIKEPAFPFSAVNKAYVDNKITGLHWQHACRAASTTNETLANLFDGQSLDGVVLATGDYILLKDQTTGQENGVYIVQVAGAPNRAPGMTIGEDAAGDAVYVTNGTLNATKSFVCQNALGTGIIGTDVLSWALFANGTAYSAGDGINITGMVISVDGTVMRNDTVAQSATGVLTLTQATPATSASTGTLVLSGVGGMGVGGSVWIGDELHVASTAEFNGAVELKDATTANHTGATGAFSVTGGIYVADANVATATSGSISTAGGVYIGGNAVVKSTTNATSATTGALVVDGGLGIANTIWAGNDVKVNGGTNATSASTGDLVVAGGAGIGDTLFIGGTNAGAALNSPAAAVSVPAGGAYFGSTTVAGAGAGCVRLEGGAMINENLHALGTQASVEGTASGAIYTAGGINTADATDADSGTGTGALVVTGGVLVRKNLVVDVNVFCVEQFSSSDARRKEVQGEIKNPTQLVEQLRPVCFEWKEEQPDGKVQPDKLPHYGVLAQEVEAVCPELVATAEDGFKSVNYQSMFSIMLASHKELIAAHQTLREEFAQLAAKQAMA